MEPQRFLTVTVLLFVFCSQLMLPAGYAQTTSGTILGTVVDQSGAVISEVTITIKNADTGMTRAIATDNDGRYRVPNLPVGRYQAKAERKGFSSRIRSGIDLTVGRDAVIDFQLEVGNVEDVVSITGEGSPVETTTSALAGLVGEHDMRELPLNGRDVFQLTTLQPGVVSTASITATIGGGPMNVGPGNTKIAVNGARMTSNNFLLDGTSVNDTLNNTPGSVSGNFTGVETLREFQILTNSFSAEYAGGGGAIINTVSKSGTNRIHGSLFEFHRNDNFDARNFFDPGEVPEFRRNQFGATVGGPIRLNKTFFFGSYEGFRETLGVSRRFFVPTAATRARAVPSVKPFVDLYPAPNGEDLGNGTAFFIRPASDTTRDDFFTVRIDHQFSSEDSLFGRYTFDDSDVSQQTLVIQDAVTNGRNQYFTLSEDHIFSPRVLNTFRFGFNRSFIIADEPFVVDGAQSLSFVPGRPLGSFFGLAEISPLAQNLLTPRFFAFNHFEFTDHVLVTRGAHSLKMGFTARRIQLNATSPLVPSGVYIYFGVPPNPLFPNGLTTLDTFLLGLPAAFLAPQPGSDFYRGIRQSVFGSFIQDDWKLTPRLTLNIGLRYEFITTPTEVNDKIANLRHATDPAVTVGGPFFDNPSKKNFAPRVGFAYDLTGDGKTSVRGGYGIFDILILPFDYRFEMSNQPPFAGTSTVIGPPPFFFPAPFPNAFDSIANAAPTAVSVNSFDFEPNRAYMQQFNLSVQRQLLPDLVVSAAYVGSRGVHLSRSQDLNQRTDFFIQDGRKFFPVLPPGVDPASKRLNPNFATIRHKLWDGNSNYNALQVRAEQRFSRGLAFQASYTLGKAIDDASTGTGGEFSTQPAAARQQDSFDSRSERSRSNFDVRHAFVLNGTYEIPANKNFHGITDKLLNGWQVTGILTTRTGFPFHPILGFDRANDASATEIAQRPDVVPGRSYESAITGRVEQYVDPTAFQLPPENSYGNSGRNVLEGPGLATFDLGVFKNTTIGERVRLQFRAEAFNLFNHANFAIPDNFTIFENANATVPGSFGRINKTTTTSRQIQFGLKLIY